MYRVLYVGERIDSLIPSWVCPSVQVQSDASINNETIDEFDIVIYDGEPYGKEGFIQASLAKSKIDIKRLVWIYIQSSCEQLPLESCYREGFDDVVLAVPKVIEQSLLRATLLVEQKKHYIEQIGMAQSMARMALTNSSELGSMIRLLADLVKTDDVNQFAYWILDWFANHELNVCLQIRFNGKVYEYSSCSLVRPIENKLLSEGTAADRIVALGKKYLFNESKISFLIKNMPTEDPDKTGRLKDHVATIIHTCESLLGSMKVKLEKKQATQESILSGVNDFKQQLMEVNEEILQYLSSCRNQFDQMKSLLMDHLLAEDLSDSQLDRINQVMSDLNQDNADLDDLNFDLESKISLLEQQIRIALP